MAVSKPQDLGSFSKAEIEEFISKFDTIFSDVDGKFKKKN
jgi:hypothetical protein